MPASNSDAVRVLFVFFDGVGIGPDDPDRNPFLRTDLPTLTRLCGGRIPTLAEPAVGSGERRSFPLSATLDTEGTPRSGTGQTALLVGRNTARLHGGHFGPWTPVRLRPLLAEENLLKRARDGGHSVAFANAYPPGFPGDRSLRLVAAPPLAARSAGLLTRHSDALARGEAVASEIVNEGWIQHLGRTELPRVTPEAAGTNLARIASRHRLTFFAHYATDRAGHHRRMEDAVGALARVDAFLGGVVSGLGDDALLLVASDHGNLEDVTRQHTRNPVLGILAGPGAGARGAGLRSITDVPGAVLEWLGGAG